MSEKDTKENLKCYIEGLNEELPASVTRKLKVARYDALLSPNEHRNGWAIPALVFALIACIGLIVTNTMAPQLRKHTVQPDVIAGIDELSSSDMALLSESDELDLLENVEFILWLTELKDAELG